MPDRCPNPALDCPEPVWWDSGRQYCSSQCRQEAAAFRAPKVNDRGDWGV